jgi:DNA topoisomerase-1
VEAVLSAEAARKAGLRYVTSKGAGLTRVPFRQSFKYLDAHGQRITDAETLGRIRKLVIPPAWRNVWISASEDAHLQATGIDARGRKQYRYHADYRAIRDSVKFDKLLKFGKALPRIHAAVEADLKLEGLQKRKFDRRSSAVAEGHLAARASCTARKAKRGRKAIAAFAGE